MRSYIFPEDESAGIVIGTPHVWLGTSGYGRDYRVDYGCSVLDRSGLNLELDVDAQRRESQRLKSTTTEFSGGPA